MGGMQRAGGVVLAAVLSLGMVACGDDSNDEAGQSTTTTEGGTDVDLDDFTGECAALVAAFAGASGTLGSVIGGAPLQDLEEAAQYFEEVASRLPDDIRADFEIFAGAYADYAEAFAEADIDFSDPSSIDPEKLAALEALGEVFSDPEVTEATANVEAYLDTSCDAG